MKTLSLSFITAALITTTSVANAAPQYPFPQNKTYPYGTTFQFANPDLIKQKFKVWKNAWYTEAGSYYAISATSSENANKGMPSNTARVISPNEDAKLTVSEGIAYGMLLMVYMSDNQNDYQTEFNKLWRYWKCYGKGLNGNGCDSWSGQGMDWEINNVSGNVEGSGTASDAEFDAAVALIMAYKQWGQASYLDDAKKLIAWTKSNDMLNDGSIKPGSNWNPAFNPSYSSVGAFKLFAEVTNDNFWNTAVTTTMNHLRLCQNTTTGLMPDWCDWNSHQGTTTNAAVGTASGAFGDDAARTPWRMSWGYYWYGIESAKAANDALEPWLLNESYEHATMIKPGYALDGTPATASKDAFVSSTYSGGLGISLASSSNPKFYLETVYETLINTAGKDSLRSKSGENYFASTLNILYLLTMTGNLPNLYNLTGYTSFTPNPNGVRMPKQPEGTLVEKGAGVKVSGFEHWGSYFDDLGVTKMFPDSGSTAIFTQADGANIISAEMYIAPEPTYIPNVELDYPFAGIAVSFAEDEHYFDLSDLKTIRLRYKSQGVLRFALLDNETLLQDQEGGEPGYYLHPTETYQTIEIDISADAYGNFVELSYPSWVNYENKAVDVLKAVRGFKIDAKMPKAGYASIQLADATLLDAAGNIITSLKDVNLPILKPATTSKATLAQVGKEVLFNGFTKAATLRVFDMNGNTVKQLTINGNGSIPVQDLTPAQGTYILRISENHFNKTIRLTR